MPCAAPGRWSATFISPTAIATLSASATRICRPSSARWPTSATTVIFPQRFCRCPMAVALVNATVFWALLAQGRIRSSAPVPLSLLFGAGLLFIVLHVRREAVSGLPWLRFVACAACAVAFPLLQVLGFGKTDYRRPADVAVVFGARAYADGRPSDALADRVRTACELYQQGVVRQLVFSGGPGDGAIHETQCMRRMAVGLGVPDSAIVRDEAGLNTSATLRNTRHLLTAKPAIAVSEF